MKEDSILLNNEEDKIDYSKYGKFLFLEFTKELIRNSSPEEILKIKNRLQEEAKKVKEIPKEEKKLDLKLEKRKERIREIVQAKERVSKSITEEEFQEILEKEKIPEEEERFPSILSKEKPLYFEKEEESKIFPRKEEEEEFPSILREEKPLFFKKEEEFPNMQRYRKIIEVRPKTPRIEEERTQDMSPFRELKLIIPETKFPIHLQYIRPVPINKEIDLGKLNPLINDRFVRRIECYGPDLNVFVKGTMGDKKTGIILNSEEIKQVVDKFSKETKIPVHEGIFEVVSGKLMFFAIISDVVGTKFIIQKMQIEERQEYHIQPRMRY